MRSTDEITYFIFDVAGMQRVNETGGYEFGDRVLKDIESKLQSVFTRASVRRLAGDEFSVTQLDANPAELSSKARQLARNIRETFSIELSWGVGTAATEWDGKRAATLDLFRKRRSSRDQKREVGE